MLDLGSGGGIDVLLSARRVGPSGMADGLDMTDEMLELARRNQAQAGVEQRAVAARATSRRSRWRTASVDVVISNCVINLSGDKPRVLREAARVLKAGGRFAVSDVIADPDMDAATRADMAPYTGCIAGALTRSEFRRRARGSRTGARSRSRRPTASTAAATAAIIRARKPHGGCCDAAEQARCCEPEEKAGCCDSSQTSGGGCGCR